MSLPAHDPDRDSLRAIRKRREHHTGPMTCFPDAGLAEAEPATRQAEGRAKGVNATTVASGTPRPAPAVFAFKSLGFEEDLATEALTYHANC